MKKSFRRWCQGLAALALCAFALPSQATEATKISDVAYSTFFRGGKCYYGNAGFNGGSWSTSVFNGNFTDYQYMNGSAYLVIDVSHIVTDPDGQAFVTDVIVGHQGNSKYSLYYTTDPAPDYSGYTTGSDGGGNYYNGVSSDDRTWIPIDGASQVQEAGTKTYGVNQIATAIKYVFDTYSNWNTSLAEVEVQGYEYVPVTASVVSDYRLAKLYSANGTERGFNGGWNGDHYIDTLFNGNFDDDARIVNETGAYLLVDLSSLYESGLCYVTDVSIGHSGSGNYSLYYTTDDVTWTPIAENIHYGGKATYPVNANATKVKYVFASYVSWAGSIKEFQIEGMDPASLSCLHPNVESAQWALSTPATCTENGYEERFCPDCGERFERENSDLYPKLGHVYVATLTSSGTASGYGSGTVTCSRAGCDFHIDFNSNPNSDADDIVDLTTLGGEPVNGVVQYTDLTVSSSGGQDGGISPGDLIDGNWDNGWNNCWFSKSLSHNEWIQFSFGTTIELTKIEYSVLNQYQTVDFYKYDPSNGVETLLASIPIVKDETEGAPGYQRKTLYFFGGGETETVFVDAIRMRIGDYVYEDENGVEQTIAYIGYSYRSDGVNQHTGICEVHPWGTIAGAGMIQPAAMIGNVGYETLAEAVEAVASNAVATTITVQDDLDLTGTANNIVIPAGKNVTLDLNGHTIAADVDGDILVQGALTLTDLLGGGKIYAVAPTGNRGIIRVEGGTFTMAGGAIESVPDPSDPGENGSYAVVYRANSTVNVTGGSITAGWFCLSGNGNDKTGKESAVTISGGTLLSTADYAVFFPNAGTLSITGGQISGAAGALAAKNGTVSITGGTFLSSGTGDIQPGTDGTAGLGDVAVNIVGQYGETSATISGGTFTAAEQAVVLSTGNNGASLEVSGGTFSQAVQPEYCAPGFVPVANEDGGTTTYGVKPVWTVSFVNDKGVAPTNQVYDVVAGVTVFAAEPDPAPTATGYTFDGWFEDGAATAWDFANDAVTNDLVLTAGWTLNQHTVAFEWHDGAVTNDYDYGTAAADVAVPRDPPTYVENDTIYTFTGWDADVADVTADATYTAVYSSAAAAARVNGGSYATLAEAIAAAQDGDTVLLLGDVTLDARVEPNPGANTAITIDLGGNTITRTGTSGNGSAFDVKSGSVTITNGVIDCTQDDTDIAKDGVYAITSRSGSNVTLADLTVTVDSECGACAYPFAGSTMTIESGTYANVTTTPYRYNTAITGMAVNQPNNATQNLIIKGGSFSQYDPQLGDDSGAMTDFTDDGFVAIQDGSGNWVVQTGYNVTFDADGGTPAPAAQRVAAGGTAAAPAAPAKEGYTFDGWKLNDAAYDFDTVLSGDITLVAAWTAVTPAGTPEVDIGGGLETYKAEHPGEEVPDPVAFDAATGKFEASFVAPVAGKYFLKYATALGTDPDAWTDDAGSAKTVEAGTLVTLEESTTADTAKFFVIAFGEPESGD